MRSPSTPRRVTANKLPCRGRPPLAGDPGTREREVFMTQTAEAPVAPPPRADERVGRKSPLARLLARPEAGDVPGAVGYYTVFFFIAPAVRRPAPCSTVHDVSTAYSHFATPDG